MTQQEDLEIEQLKNQISNQTLWMKKYRAEIASLKAQLSKSVRVHSMSEHEYQDYPVCVITDDGSWFISDPKIHHPWMENAIGWIDPREFIHQSNKHEIETKREAARKAGCDSWDGLDPKKELEQQ